jgi:hypothetical protein
MRSYQGIFLCLGLIVSTTGANAFAQEEDPAQSPPETPATPTDNAPLEAPPPLAVPPPSPVKTQPKTAPRKGAVPNSTSPLNPGTGVAAPAAGAAPLDKSKAGKLKQIRKVKRKETAEALIKRRGSTSIDNVIVGEAQVLPKNVFRLRYIMRTASGDKGYDSAGKEFSAGASLNITGHAFVAEYGITDRIVLQMITPYTSSNELAINANEFKKSAEYGRQFEKLVDTVTPSLIARGLCSDAAQCRAAIDNGLALGVATPIELPSGETATVGANVPIREAANSIILKAVEPAAGKSGLGDIQFGLGYNFYSSPRNVITAGLGLRIPTGLFSDVASAYRAPGSGFLATGLLFRYDLRLNPVVFSFSHQAEYSLNKAKRSRSSMINPRYLNTEDPTNDDENIVGAGDGVSNDYIIERKGIYHEGFGKVAYALGSLTRWLKPVAVYGYYSYIVDPEYQYQGHLYSKKRELYTASYAFSIDGLAMEPMIPVSFTYRREIAIGGRNASLAPDSDYFQFNFYYKF